MLSSEAPSLDRSLGTPRKFFPAVLVPNSVSQHPSHDSISPLESAQPQGKGSSIKRSTSFKSKPLQHLNGLGCTYYGKHSFYNPRETRKERFRSPIHKKLDAAMYKTTSKWNQPEANSYGTIYDKKETKITRKNRIKLSNQLLVGKSRLEELKRLPRILFKNDIKFNASPTSSKKDEYIHYIINNKRKQTNILNAKSFKEKVHNNSLVEASKVLAREMNVEGINFEVHYKCNSSPEDSFDYMDTNIRKDMNLIHYDFNGIGKRIASDSPQPRCNEGVRKASLRPVKAVCPNRTTTKFFPAKDNKGDKMRFTMRGQDESAVSLHNTKMTEEDKEFSLSDVYESDSENSDTAEMKEVQSNTLDSFATKSMCFFEGRATNNREVEAIGRTEKEVKEWYAFSVRVVSGNENAMRFKEKILCFKAQIQDDISEMSSEESHDSKEI